ncbi:MAG: nitric oxide reductase transcriptional regulator NorR [bacterium]|nr:nitric oxide reductase transcriptional regulator NorR [bacterium]
MGTASGPFDLLLSIALDLNASLTAADRSSRLIEAVRHVLPCDAAVLLRADGDDLVPIEAFGLSPDALGRRYPRREHPRLDVICSSREPTRFPADSPLPDPFDGLLAELHDFHRIHACLGCPLWVEDELVGVLTADARAPHAFDAYEDRFLAALSALAGAAMRTSDLIESLEMHAHHQGLVANDLSRDVLQRRGGQLIGRSPVMERLLEEIALVARSDFPVLITGETGVGKELVTRTLHAESSRADAPLIYVNCAALPESVAESELFGHVRGAFTGAHADRAGKFEVAGGGTLFLDEVGELPLGLQPKLLRALQEGEIQRVGADHTLNVDVRVLAATNRDLTAEVEARRFRVDLLHRLDVCRVAVPPLRDRRSDIVLLAGAFCDEARRRLGIGPVRLAPDVRRALEAAAWPGNVRELENVISRSVLRASARAAPGEPVVVRRVDLGDVADTVDVDRAPEEAIADKSLRDATDGFQRKAIRAAVERHKGNWSAAARDLGLHRSNLHHLAKRLGMRD